MIMLDNSLAWGVFHIEVAFYSIGFYFLVKENWTEENGIVLQKTTGPGWPRNEWIVELTGKS